MPNIQYQITGYELIREALAELDDNPLHAWDAYPCLEWKRYRDAHGYGALTIKRKVWLVHRIAYELAVGAIPEGLDILHHCDNPPCFRPIHLFPGTHADNMHDMYAKGRRIAARGEGQHLAKLNAEQIPLIRKLNKQGIGQRKLAAQFGVTKNAIMLIVHRRTWKHID